MNGTARFRRVPPAGPLAPHLLRAALVVAVLGVLPFALEAHVTWQVLGPPVSAAVLARSLQLLWHSAFSTDPRHLDP